MPRLTPTDVERIKKELRFDWELGSAMKPALNTDTRDALDDELLAPNLVQNIRTQLDPYLTAFIANGCRKPRDLKLPGRRNNRKVLRLTQKFALVIQRLIARCRSLFGRKPRKPELRKATRKTELFVVEVILRTSLAAMV